MPMMPVTLLWGLRGAGRQHLHLVKILTWDQGSEIDCIKWGHRNLRGSLLLRMGLSAAGSVLVGLCLNRASDEVLHRSNCIAGLTATKIVD